MQQYIPYAAGIVTAIFVVLAGGRWFRRTAWRVGLIDGPRLRGVHAEPVAKSGGVTIVAALITSLVAQMITARALGLESSYLSDVDHLYLLLPALVIAALGLIDDLHPLGAGPKLLVQAACGVVAWFLLFRIDGAAIGTAEWMLPEVLSLPVTVVFIVAITNAFNLIDGVDGLCSGAAFIALAGIGLFATLGGEFRLELALPVAVAAAAFMRFNFGRPKAFLGDSGSMLLGFLVGSLALRAVVTPTGAVDVVPLFLLLSLPVVDITFVVFRRLVQGTHPLRADRGHIHHILMLQFSGNALRTSLTLMFMASLGAAGAMWFRWQSSAGWTGVTAVVAGAAVALPVGLYYAVYALGGYASLRNLLNAGAASDAARRMAKVAESRGAREGLTDEALIEWMDMTDVTAIALFDADSNRVWSAGIPDPERDVLTIPLFASGRVERGHVILQGAGRPGRLAFAAQLLLPLYPAFMELLALQTAEKTRVETSV